MANIIIKAVIGVGITTIVFAVLYKIRELVTESDGHKKKIKDLYETIDNFVEKERNHKIDFCVLMQKIEYQKCYCKRKPLVGIEKINTPFGSNDRVKAECQYQDKDITTGMCLAKDKKYIENKIKELQANERERVLGNHIKEAKESARTNIKI